MNKLEEPNKQLLAAEGRQQVEVQKLTALIHAKVDSYAVEESVLVGSPVKNDA